MFDVAVVGGGVVGGQIFRQLTRYDLKVCLIEKEADIAMGASQANSGIVHAGFDAKEGSKKAEFNVKGARMMEKVCAELGVEFKRNGAFVVGFSDEDKITLENLKQRGETNGVEGLEVIGKEDLLSYLPDISKSATCALYAKTSAIVCPYSLAFSAVGNAMDNGGELFREFKLVKVEKQNGFYNLISDSDKQVQAKYVVNASGLFSDEVAKLFGDDSLSIKARKGEYYLLDKSVAGITPYTIFTCPTEKGKGVLVSQTADGNLIVGPNAEFTEKGDTSTTHAGLSDVMQKARLLFPTLDFTNTITSFSGLRSVSSVGDFIIEKSKKADNLFNVSGIESPGLTASPAIGEYVAEFVAKEFNAKLKSDFNPIRAPYSVKNLSREQRNALIRKNPSYGEIVCRCETISLGEIEDALTRNPKAVTVDGVKRRVRAGMGRCQGGFCQGRILELLKTSLGVSEYEVTKKGGNSYILEKNND